VIAVDEARQHLADQIVKHTHKAKKVRVDEAVASTEVTLSKIIAVNAVELLSNFPADLWKQLHSARTQVCISYGQDAVLQLKRFDYSFCQLCQAVLLP
jgi:hypothetical protein